MLLKWIFSQQKKLPVKKEVPLYFLKQIQDTESSYYCQRNHILIVEKYFQSESINFQSDADINRCKTQIVILFKVIIMTLGLCRSVCVYVRVRPSPVKVSSVLGWNSGGQINDIVLKTFLSFASYLLATLV